MKGSLANANPTSSQITPRGSIAGLISLGRTVPVLFLPFSVLAYLLLIVALLLII